MPAAMDTNVTQVKNVIFAISCGLLLLVVVMPAWAQTAYLSPAKIKAETRKSKKEAAVYEAEYKDTHLNIDHYSYKIGKAGRKHVIVDEGPADYQSDKEKNALFENRKLWYKKKKLLKAQKQQEE